MTVYLSLREQQTLRLHARGLSHREIANGLGLAKSTVTDHLKRARGKLGATTTDDAVTAAHAAGIHLGLKPETLRVLPSPHRVSRADRPVGTSGDWRDRAACRGMDGELFFPVGSTGPAATQIEKAKAVCRTCMAVDACLRYAIETGQEHGVYGGTSEDERRTLKRRASRSRARTA